MSFGSLAVRGSYLQRSTNFADYLVRQREGTTALKLWSATSLDAAYNTYLPSLIVATGLTARLECPVTKVGAIAQSPTIQQRGWTVAETRRGHTSFQFAPSDFAAVDEQLLYLRVQEQRGGAWMAVPAGINAGAPILGPITVLPPITFFGNPGMLLALSGSAPAGTGATAGAPPPVDFTFGVAPSMYVALPRPASVFAIRNLSASDAILVSLGLGLPMVRVGPNTRYCPTGEGPIAATVTEFVVASATAATVAFSAEAVFPVA
jgi:hypothetical protein